ncbi:MAG: hypothetical protein ABSC53_06595 [Bacteroidota bacterium]
MWHLTIRFPPKIAGFRPAENVADTEKRANSAQQVPLSILILSSGMAPKALTDGMSVHLKMKHGR